MQHELSHFLSRPDPELLTLDPPCAALLCASPCSRKGRRGAARRAPAAAEPAHSQGSRGRAQRRRSNEDGDYTPAGSSGDEEYKPTTRSGRTSRRTAAASAAIRAATEHTGAPSGGSVRWERGCVCGPCTNPDCDNPNESPQWRKGPPACPVLCNACGTRWLRNGSLKPLVVSRGCRAPLAICAVASMTQTSVELTLLPTATARDECAAPAWHPLPSRTPTCH